MLLLDVAPDLLFIVVDGVVTFFIYRCYIQSKQLLKAIQNIVNVPIDSNIKHVLQREEHNKIPFAVIEGNVRSLGGPLLQSVNQNYVGVLQTIVNKQHKLRRSKVSNMWYDVAEDFSVIRNYVPFGLQNTKYYKSPLIEIQNVMDCSQLPSNLMSEKFIPSEENFSLFRSVVSFLYGEKDKGTQVIEKMLTENTTLNAYGELYINSFSKSVKLRAPSNGLPLILTTKTTATLIKEEIYNQTFYKTALILCGSLGIFFVYRLGKKIYPHLQARWRQFQEHRDFQDIIQIRNGTNGDNNNRESSRCVICLNNPCEIIVLECRHLCLCADCAQTLSNTRQANLCPICRVPISRMIPFYLP